jgi:hypothetical protein
MFLGAVSDVQRIYEIRVPETEMCLGGGFASSKPTGAAPMSTAQSTEMAPIFGQIPQKLLGSWHVVDVCNHYSRYLGTAFSENRMGGKSKMCVQ